MSAARAQLPELQRSIDRLARAVRALRAHRDGATSVVLRQALLRRGLLWKKVVHNGCVLPRTRKGRDECYQLLHHYSFRLFLRDVIKHRQRFGISDLQHYCSAATARRYLDWLIDRRLVRRTGRRYHLAVDTHSFGSTLEWFVASVLEKEYGIPAVWNVRLDAARGGGDYDVIGFQDGACIYVETKSSPPRNIETRQIHAFFDRLETLRPQVAIFLNDTQLRMGDKIAVLFAAELQQRLGRRMQRRRVERLSGELFTIGGQVFIANSDPDLADNLGVCLAHYFRGQGFHMDGGA
ncbi:MAG TPA: hypothetical protein VMW56_11065 [Candidatus Margulisiibacteriota bacterium]|nr:hypothetical protein [Candidatus Margulisiibacteriota bacterium]